MKVEDARRKCDFSFEVTPPVRTLCAIASDP